MAYTSVPLLVLLIGSIFSLSFCVAPLHALNIGLQVNSVVNGVKQCSRTCESQFCDAGPPTPLFRYGKYCGILYGGCAGEQPCDGLDECCMHHDHCIDQMRNDYLSEKCNKELVMCLEAFKESDESSFRGSTCDAHRVAESIQTAVGPALVAAQVLGKH